jgi:hypothetical protein
MNNFWNPSFRCDNTASGIRFDRNISPFFTFRFDGIRFDGSESSQYEIEQTTYNKIRYYSLV